MKTSIPFLSHFPLCHWNTWPFVCLNTSEAASLNFGGMYMQILSKRLHSGWSMGMETNLGRIDSLLMSYAQSGADSFQDQSLSLPNITKHTKVRCMCAWAPLFPWSTGMTEVSTIKVFQNQNLIKVIYLFLILQGFLDKDEMTKF